VKFARYPISNLCILLDFCDLSASCTLLRALALANLEGVATKIEELLLLAAVLRDESYVFSNFPDRTTAQPSCSEKRTRECLRRMCHTAGSIIRALDTGNLSMAVLCDHLASASTRLQQDINELRMNEAISWV
jgi:hypothetical protein